MQLLFDFFPIIAFFAAYKFYGIYTATVVIIVASLAQSGIHYLRTRTVNKMHLFSAGLVLVFGSLTLVLKDARFIQWKPSILYWLMAAAFIISTFVGEKPLVQRMMGQAITLERNIWVKLNSAWAAFFTFTGALNLYVAYHFDENTWVNFKLIGLLGLTVLFALAQGLWLWYKMPEEERNK